MKKIETTMDIQASPREAWAVLTDFERYPEWSRFVVTIRGQARVGAHLEVLLDDGARKMTFRPVVLAATDAEELRWKGVVGAAFLLSGEHYIRLEPLPEGGTRLVHGEIFRGMLRPLLGKGFDERTRRAFGEFNTALAKRCETTGAAIA